MTKRRATEDRKTKCRYCAVKPKPLQRSLPGPADWRKRKKTFGTPTEYETRAAELLRIKEEVLNRVPGYVEEREVLLKQLPREGQWSDQQFAAYWSFIQKWDLARAAFSLLKRDPYSRRPRVRGGEAFGVIELSDLDSDMLVFGIDLRHDPAQIASFIADTIRNAQLIRQSHREPAYRWKRLRALSTTRRRLIGDGNVEADSPDEPGTDFMQECEEALRAWDMKQDGWTTAQIRDELFPEASKVLAGDRRAARMDPEKNPENAMLTTRRRLAWAKHLIEHEGYREILPLTGSRSRQEAEDQWLVSSGLTRRIRHSEGGSAVSEKPTP